MKVSKNQIQNVSFSQKKEEVKPQQAELQDGEEKMAKSLDCLASQVPVVKKDSFAKQKADLEERLNVLNKSTALHREYFPKDDERFGSDGIKSILDAVDTVEKINIVNKVLDILEDTENPQRGNIWTGSILKLIDSKFGGDLEDLAQTTSNLPMPNILEPTTTPTIEPIADIIIEPTTDVSPINNSPSEEDPLQQAHDELTSKVWSIALDESRYPVNNEDIDKLLALADSEEKIAYVNAKLDELDTYPVLQKSPHWAYTIAEWLKQNFED